jgi:hypothetical protein
MSRVVLFAVQRPHNGVRAWCGVQAAKLAAREEGRRRAGLSVSGSGASERAFPYCERCVPRLDRALGKQKRIRSGSGEWERFSERDGCEGQVRGGMGAGRAGAGVCWCRRLHLPRSSLHEILQVLSCRDDLRAV